MKFLSGISLAAVVAMTGSVAFAADLTVGVSWSNFQEERWKTDEAAIKGALEAGGADYISADAQSSSSKQLSDIESLIAQGVDALIVLAQDTQAIGPAIQAAADEGIPVIAMTSYAMAGDRERLLNAGCDGYVEKPFDPSIIMDKINEAIGT